MLVDFYDFKLRITFLVFFCILHLLHPQPLLSGFEIQLDYVSIQNYVLNIQTNRLFGYLTTERVKGHIFKVIFDKMHHFSESVFLVIN